MSGSKSQLLLCQVGAKARAVVEEAKGVEEEDTGKFKQVETFEVVPSANYFNLSGIRKLSRLLCCQDGCS